MDQAANAAALEKVRADKLREATDGCDGTWVAHPGLVSVAKAVFDEHMPAPNQVQRQRDDVRVTAADLLNFQPARPITEAGAEFLTLAGYEWLTRDLGVRAAAAGTTEATAAVSP